MYNSTEHNNNNLNIKIIPKISMDDLMTTNHIKSTASILDAHHDCKYLNMNNDHNDVVAIKNYNVVDNGENDNNDNKNDVIKKNDSRPTYGAYLRKTLPRGPYLQYKFNDYQTTQSLGHQFNDNNDNNRLLQLQIKTQSNFNSLKTKSATTTQAATNLSSTTMTTANTLPRAKYKTSIITNKPFDLNFYEEMNTCNLVNENQRIKNDKRISSEWQINSNVFTYKDDRFNENNDNDNENYRQQKNDEIERNQYYKQIVTEKLNENQQHQDKRNQIMSIPNDVMYSEGKIMLNNKNYWNNGNIAQQRNIENEPEINLEIDLHQADNNKQLQSIRRNHFLKQIQQKNSNMMTRMTAGIRTTAEKAFTYTENTNNHGKNFSTMLHAPKQIVNEVNYITLADVMRSRSEGLNEIEGWAILCQAVQALQDMFLGDFPTTSKILPLVKTTTIQITSRGRIVFNIITLSQLDKFNDVSTSSFNVTDHLSPEYRNNIGKSMFFAESDMEKMWIYSLGIALRDTIDSNQSLSRNQQKFYKKYLQNDDENNYNRNIFNNDGSVLSITEVIDCMCKRNIHQRASLMYLLDVISLFCREHKQMKPFSHIVMEIFQSIINHQLPAITEQSDFHYKNNNNNRLTSVQIIETNQISDSVKSETDSGRSSAHGERDLTPPCIDKRKSCLKVRRDNNFNCQPIEYDLCGTIGYSIVDGGVRYNHNNQESANNRANQQLQVFRKNRKDIWKKKNDFRRNTIDVSCFDIEKAKQIQQLTNFNLTNSTEFVSKLIGQSTGLNTNYETKDIHKMYQSSVEGTSLPDLCPIVQPTNTNNLNFIGNKFLRSKDIKLSKAYSEGNFTNKLILKRPEFVVNSKLPAIKEICITESKCQHKKNVNVILLNGQIIKIICNSITTTTRQILETIFQSENYIENFFIGLCAFIGGDFVFLPSNLKIYKVAPQSWINSTRKSSNAGPSHLHDSSNFTLYIRIKFLLPTLRGISSLESRHMLYLQLRKSILERHILCTNEDLINLGGIALQAEMGDFKDSTKCDREEYFIISHYLPEGMYNHSNKTEMAKYLRSSHFSRKGLHQREAEQMFIKYIQDMKDYGFHLYSAIWTTDDGNSIDIYLGISLSGMSLFDRNSNCSNNINRSRQQSQLAIQQTLLLSSSSASSSSSSSSLPLTMASGATNNSKLSHQRKLYMNFEWLEIENLCYSKHILCIVVRKSESLKAKDNNRVKYKLKMDGRKSYFAFSLASEHHQFYMKLRNSFISLKSLSSELNIPITFHTFKDKSSEIEFPSDHRIATTTSTSTTKLMANIPTLSSLPLSSPSSSSSANTAHHTVGIKTAINDANTNLKDQTEYDYNNRIEMENPITKQLDYIKKIDKQLKASGMHVKNLKKSMLNDNRLTKLKDRLLKRSKSTAGTLIEKVTSTIIQSQPQQQQQQQQQQQNKNPRYRKQGFFRKSKESTEYKGNEQNDCRNKNDNGHSLVVMPSRNLIDNVEVSSKEENQNKENECPVKDYITDMKKSHGLLLYSPNRNRVKMGTRVFYSTQFLNKSLDNIYEPHTAVFNLCQFKSTNSLSDDKKSTENNDNDVVSCDNRLTVNRITTNSCTVADECNIRNCTKYHKLIENINHNDNGNLTCYIEKLQNVNDKFDDSIILPSSSSSSSGTEAAFVIHSSIKSDRDLHYNFTIPNETLSESLLEKFENISCSSSSNNDRILMKLTVVKERLNQTSNHLRSCEINKSSSPKGSNSSSSSVDDLHYEQYKRSDTTTTTTTDSVSCVSCNPQTVKKCSHENENLCENFKYETNKIGNGRKHSSSTCLLPTPLLSSSSSSLLSNKQHESIFIGHHKFETDEQKDNRGSDGKLMTERMTINHQKNMENDLDGFTLGISVVQGSDNNVYVKDLIKNGPGDKTGIRIGDQIIAVNGISLLNLSYNEALKKLQNTGLIVELIVSQLLDGNKISSETNIKTPSIKCNYGQKKDSSKRITRSQSNIFDTSNTTNIIVYSNNDCHDNDGGYYSSTPHSSHDTGTTATTASISTAYLDQINRLTADDIYYHPTNNFQFREMKQSKRKDILTPAKSMPDLPKVVAIIPKRVVKTGAENQLTYPRTIGNSRKYLGPVRYPVTPYKTSVILSPHKQQLSLLADSDDDQEVYI